MPIDLDHKQNLDELMVLSKCLAGLDIGNDNTLSEDRGEMPLAEKFRAAILTVLGRLGHGDPAHRVVLDSIDPEVLDRFARAVAAVDGTVEQGSQWLDNHCAAVREKADDYLQDAVMDDQRSCHWSDIAAMALVAANASREKP